MSIKMAAEVGLLTRNIKIEGGAYAKQESQSFGARIVVGRAVRSYEQAVEAVQANIQWMQKNLNIVIEWLNQNA